MRILSAVAVVVTLVLSSCTDEGAAPAAGGAVVSAMTLRFDVEGMHCTSCEKAIVAELSKLPGVTSCEASFEAGTASVVAGDPGIADEAMQRIRDLGYTARRASGE